MNLKNIEQELKKRLAIPYKWGKKQDNSWDELTNFIYQVTDFQELVNRMEKEFTAKRSKKDLTNYALNRWYNFNSARAVEYIFEKSMKVRKVQNEKDSRKDFWLQNIPFDHKTSIFPKSYQESLAFAYKNPKNLIQWLYQNQSSEKRQHFENRLFLILHEQKGEHWKLKAEISLLGEKIEEYLAKFNKNKLSKMFISNKWIYTDLIWILK